MIHPVSKTLGEMSKTKPSCHSCSGYNTLNTYGSVPAPTCVSVEGYNSLKSRRCGSAAPYSSAARYSSTRPGAPRTCACQPGATRSETLTGVL